MFRIVRNLGLGLLMAAAALPALAQEAPPARAAGEDNATRLQLSAYGQVQVVPDRAVITLGVVARAATAAQAMADDAARMTAVIGALRQAGLPDKAIQTSNLSLNAQYSYQQGQAPKLAGYQAANDVTITVDDLSRLGAAVDASVAAGADQVNGISFGLKDPQVAEDAARRAAVDALRDKAVLYAAAEGLKITRLVSLSEGGEAQPQPVRPMMMMAKAVAPSTPVSPGQLTVRIDIDGTYELGR